jgi:hypothetical protein
VAALVRFNVSATLRCESDVDAEDLIHLSGALAPADRAAFRRAAENALATSSPCWGPGSVDRVIVPLWRSYFHPPMEDRPTAWDSGKKKLSKLISEPPRDSRGRRRVRIMR